jgi:hypothetical protein
VAATVSATPSAGVGAATSTISSSTTTSDSSEMVSQQLRRDAEQSQYNAALSRRLKTFINTLQSHIEVVESLALSHGATPPPRPTLDA